MAYIQMEINNIFQNVRDWLQAYVDNIICGATFLDYMLQKLWILFLIFVAFNILIKPTKIFLNYPNVGLLGQRVNSLGLTPMEKKLKAIQELTYLDTFGTFEYYLSLTGYLYSYIYFYT